MDLNQRVDVLDFLACAGPDDGDKIFKTFIAIGCYSLLRFIEVLCFLRLTKQREAEVPVPEATEYVLTVARARCRI